MILSLADPALVKLFSGEDVPNVPDIQGQLKLVAERVMPACSGNRTHRLAFAGPRGAVKRRSSIAMASLISSRPDPSTTASR